MTQNDAFILTMAYPETIVMVADEWYSPYMRLVGIGKKNYVKAGHAALVLIDKNTGDLEYHDFGRYITPEPDGRVRGRRTDRELYFPIKAHIENDNITNLEEILAFLATNPKLTHGEGKLIASVCSKVDYKKARAHIDAMQSRAFIRYAAFIKNACNCARFVTDTLIASVNDEAIVKRLKKSKWFTPSTVGNVTIADTEDHIYEVSEEGEIGVFTTTVSNVNKEMFLDRLNGHNPGFIGTLQPKHNEEKQEHSQWLSGIAAGAWFELHDLEDEVEFRFRRISPYGNVDVDGVYRIDNAAEFNIASEYKFVQYSNCLFFHIEQNEILFKFNYLKDFNA